MSEWKPFYPSPGIKSREQFGELLVLRKLTGVAVEIGTHEGLFAETLLKSWPGHLFCVDPWRTLDDYQKDAINARDRDADYQTAMARLAPYDFFHSEKVPSTVLTSAVPPFQMRMSKGILCPFITNP